MKKGILFLLIALTVLGASSCTSSKSLNGGGPCNAQKTNNAK